MKRVGSISMSKSENHFSLFDLIPLEELQQLQDTIADINAVKSVISDPEGNPLTMPSNEIPVCQMISQLPQAYSQCIENAKNLSEKVLRSRCTEQVTCPPCRDFGIIKAAVPIIVNNVHVASWWISQYCPERTSEAQIKENALKLDLNADHLIHVLEALPRNDASHFEKTITRIDQLVGKITQLGYQNLILARDADKLHRVEKELTHYKTNIDDIVHHKTEELVQTNSRMQMEFLEHELVEEQIERKSQLLDAINQMLQSTLAPQNDWDLANRCLQLAMKLTGSSFGILVEYHDTQATMLAKAHIGQRALTGAPSSEIFELKGIWQQLIRNGDPIIRNESLNQELYHPDLPPIKSLLAVPVRNQKAITGFIALANKVEPYAPIDLNDTKALTQAFSGVLHRIRLEKSSSHSEKRLKLALDSANEGLWDFAPQSGQVYFSPRWYTMLGYSMDELASSMETWHTLTHPEDLPLLKETFQQLVQGKETSFRIEVRMLSQNAQWRWIQVRGSSAERRTDDKATRIVGTLIDISKYKKVELALQKANAELQRLAALDELTQVANRRRFDERLLQEWRRARRDHSPLAVVLGDIDYFKLYNDTYGHLKGDDTLHAVAQAIQAVLKRSMDLVARFGGEEFAIILPNTDDQGAMRVAKDVKNAVEELKIEHKTSRIGPYVTCSFGVASLIPVGDATSKTLVDRSDKALYQAKADGRNQIVPYRSDNFHEVLSR